MTHRKINIYPAGTALIKHRAVTVGCCLLMALVGLAETRTIKISSTASTKDSNKSEQIADTSGVQKRESIFGDSPSLENSHFTWGADAGASIDLTGHDMSTFDIDILLGYKNRVIKTVGVGVGIHRSVLGHDNFIPIYLLFRSSFTSKPSLCFLNIRAGYSFNTIEDSPMFGDYNAAIGCGFNLSRSKSASTYLICNLGYRYFNERHRNYVERIDTHAVWTAQLQFGVNF